jgi:hypothetical protein
LSPGHKFDSFIGGPLTVLAPTNHGFTIMDEEAKKEFLGSPEAKEMFMKRITIAGNLVLQLCLGDFCFKKLDRFTHKIFIIVNSETIELLWNSR